MTIFMFLSIASDTLEGALAMTLRESMSDPYPLGLIKTSGVSISVLLHSMFD